jgi:hypothetical protein
MVEWIQPDYRAKRREILDAIERYKTIGQTHLMRGELVEAIIQASKIDRATMELWYVDFEIRRLN